MSRIRRSVLGQRAVSERALEIAYVVLVSDDVHNYMRQLQMEILGRYGVNGGLAATTPHITLKLGFPAKRLEPFARHLEQLAAEVEPFDVRIKDLGFFDEGIIFLDVERGAALEALRRRILRDLAQQFDIQPYALEQGDRYRFHATLAHGLSSRDFARARQSLQGTTVEFRFPLERLALLCSAGGHWVTYHRAALRALR